MPASFYSRMAPAVQAATRNTVLFPSVVLAQLALESRSGASELSAKYNNYLGHKAFSSWKGRTVTFKTPNDAQKTSAFRVYNSVADCLKAHVAILNGPKYRPAQAARDPYTQVAALAKTYAEDKSYRNKLVAIMQQYDLTQYDTLQPGAGPGLFALAVLGTAAAYHFRAPLQKAATRLTRSFTSN